MSLFLQGLPVKQKAFGFLSHSRNMPSLKGNCISVNNLWDEKLFYCVTQIIASCTMHGFCKAFTGKDFQGKAQRCLFWLSSPWGLWQSHGGRDTFQDPRDFWRFLHCGDIFRCSFTWDGKSGRSTIGMRTTNRRRRVSLKRPCAKWNLTGTAKMSCIRGLFCRLS